MHAKEKVAGSTPVSRSTDLGGWTRRGVPGRRETCGETVAVALGGNGNGVQGLAGRV